MDILDLKNKYSSTAGLSTKHWGPNGWGFLFSCIMGGYPPVIDTKNKEHIDIKKNFKNMFKSLMYTMPCSFCTKSFRQFYKEIPIDTFMSSRLDMMYWLYLIRDLVNKKLIFQELECYDNEKKKLQKMYNQNKISKTKYKSLLQEKKEELLITQPSPPFKDVLDKYENLRAKCYKKAKKCIIKKKN